MSNRHKTLVVIGGGAAGFFCAVNAARINPQLRVFILEKTNKLLSKVRISGGGRCNLTHACFGIDEMIRKYPRGGNFVKKTFHQFFTKDTIDWFTQRGVAVHAEADGRMFPKTNSSQSVIDCLLREAAQYNVQIRLNTEVIRLNTKATDTANESAAPKAAFEVVTKTNQASAISAQTSAILADFVCIACGGYPKSAMFNWIKETGHSIEEPVPSLFTFNMPGNSITQLMGVAVEHATVKIEGSKLQNEGPLLITHWGMSGPAILKLSAMAARELALRNYTFTISINWLPEFNENSLRTKWQQLRTESGAKNIFGKCPFNLPQRLWQYLLEVSTVKETMRWADMPSAIQNVLIKNLVAQSFGVTGKTTFKEEFVTAGGISLSKIDPNTMMSRIVPNLFFAGEVMDVDGVTGGFNFQHAWTSGWVAAKAIAVDAFSDT